jgi:YD repeat-containing protein
MNDTVFEYAHDGNDRLESVTATAVGGGGSQLTTITYEPGSDNRQTASVAGVTTTFGWDAAGRLETRTDVVDGKTFSTSFDYYANDDVREITYPTGRQVRYEVDSEHRIRASSMGSRSRRSEPDT